MTDRAPYVHWDEIDSRRREVGHLAGTWTDLGTAAGSSTTGVQRIQIDPGRWSTPAHLEYAEEEIFFVLGGSGLSWQDGNVYEVGEGDCLVHLADEGASHTLRAGPDGLDVLAFGMRFYATATYLARAGVAWLGPTWVEAGRGGHPFEREAEAGEPEVGEPGERPPTVVAACDVPAAEVDKGESGFAERRLGEAAGSRRTGLCHVVLRPGRLGFPPHCHSADEEIFVVLEGDGVLLLGDAEHPVRRGHVVARPPAMCVSHAFRAGASGLSYLAYRTREPNDICFFPRSGKLAFRGVGVVGRIEQLDYWDGEP